MDFGDHSDSLVPPVKGEEFSLRSRWGKYDSHSPPPQSQLIVLVSPLVVTIIN